MLNERYELQIVELSFGGMKRNGGAIISESKNDAVENAVESLTDNQKIIVSEMRKNPSVSKAELGVLLGIHSSNVDRNIQKLRHMGLIVRVGPAKGGHWEVVEKKM